MNKIIYFKFCRKLLLDEISNKHKRLKQRKQQQESQNLVKKRCHLDEAVYSCCLNCVISKYVAEVKSRDARKYNCELIKSNTENSMQSNQNKITWNYSSRNLTNGEYNVLLYSLNLNGICLGSVY